MCEASDLNSNSQVERVLRDLVPEPLAVERDDLFFQVGYAAGAANRAIQFFWPSAVAALLLVCAGMAALLIRQHEELQVALAAVDNPLNQGATAGSPSSVPVENQLTSTAGLASSGARGLSDDRWRQMQRLMAPTASLRGQLTAGGWTQARAGMGNDEPRGRQSDAAEPEAPRRPATYLELLHQYQEG